MKLAATEYAHIQKLIREHAGIVLDDGKYELVMKNLDPLLADEGISGYPELIERLRASFFGPLHREVIERMTTNETSFFRDQHPYETLRQHLLPELIAQRKTERRLSIWSAACSCGQEPYSVAMLISEHFPEVQGWGLRILATDVSGKMIQKAREGVYTSFDVSRGLPSGASERHFDKIGPDEYRLKSAIRRMVEFRQHNLVAAQPDGELFDVVLLRNVLIYFDVTTKKKVLQTARAKLRTGGCMLVGASEIIPAMPELFEEKTLGKTRVLFGK